jgi:ribonuclease P protein component
MTDGVARPPDGKFAKRERILKTGDFRIVYKKGRSVKSGPFVLCYLASSRPYSRLGFSIASRNVKLAVQRNRLRRIFREAYRRNKDLIRKPHDLVIVVKGLRENDIGYIYAENAIKRLFRLAEISS